MQGANASKHFNITIFPNALSYYRGNFLVIDCVYIKDLKKKTTVLIVLFWHPELLVLCRENSSP